MTLKLQTFTTRYLRTHAGFWSGDIDRNPKENIVQVLSNATYVSMDRIYETGLASYSGILWEHYRLGPLPWITTVGRIGRERYAFGQQYCRLCLLEDATPYFRKSWRLAFNTVCPLHNIYLRDCCSYCGSPVAFHTGDFAKVILPEHALNTVCSRCQSDLRQPGLREDDPADSHHVNVQNRLLNLVQHGHGKVGSLTCNYSHLFFAGLHRLVFFCCSQSRLKRITCRLLLSKGLLDMPLKGHGSYMFESMRVGDRALILNLAWELMWDWPYRFVQLCKDLKISSSYLCSYRMRYPYWLIKEIDWHLNDRDYAPSPSEFASVASYLETIDMPVNQSNINLLLGVSAVSLVNQSMLRERWNPRGIKNEL